MEPKLCLSCARAKLAGQKIAPCGSCILLNVDPLAQVRARASRAIPVLRYSPLAFACNHLGDQGETKPARATSSRSRE